MNLSCDHGENGLQDVCEPCLRETRRANFLLGKLVGYATIRTFLEELLKQRPNDTDLEGLLTRIGQESDRVMEGLKPKPTLTANVPAAVG